MENFIARDHCEMDLVVVVTRHAALIDHLIDIGVIDGDTPVLTHVTPDDVRGKHVIGVLPMHLAVEARSITEVPLKIPAELRGQELDLGQVRDFASHPVTYHVLARDDVETAISVG